MRRVRQKTKTPRAPGRPPGRKNNLTLLREAESEKALKLCTGEILANIHGVVQAVIQRALDGDMTAAKLLLDRVVPSKKSIEHLGEISHVHVNITGVTVDAETATDVTPRQGRDDGQSKPLLSSWEN